MKTSIDTSVIKKRENMEDLEKMLLSIALGFCTICCGYTIWKLSEIAKNVSDILNILG